MIGLVVGLAIPLVVAVVAFRAPVVVAIGGGVVLAAAGVWGIRKGNRIRASRSLGAPRDQHTNSGSGTREGGGNNP